MENKSSTYLRKLYFYQQMPLHFSGVLVRAIKLLSILAGSHVSTPPNSRALSDSRNDTMYRYYSLSADDLLTIDSMELSLYEMKCLLF